MAQMDKASFEALQRAAIAHAKANGIEQPTMTDYQGFSKADGDVLMASMWGHKEAVFSQPANRRVMEAMPQFSGQTHDEMRRAQIALITSPSWKKS